MLTSPFSRLFLIAAIVLSTITPALADPYSDGVAAYKAKNFSRAAQLMQSALKQDPRNPDAMFYLGMAKTHMTQYDAARQAFEMVIQTVSPNDPLADKARTNITWLTKQQITTVSSSGKAAKVLNASLSRNSKPNYLTHVIPGGKVVHFASNKMPLKVYIADGLGVQGWSGSMKEAVVHAMRAWQGGTRGKVSFTRVYNEDSADIIVKWRRNFSDNILGVSPFQTVGDTILRSDITLAVYYPDSQKPIPMNELKAIAVHEMGHAIGIRGHSPYPGDIMYYSRTHVGNALSQRDMNTIAMLYKLDADVQNNTGMTTAQARKYYELVDQGIKAQTSNKPAEAIASYRAAIQINGSQPEAKFNLGAVLINEGNKMMRQNNLSAAKRNFEEASRIYSEIMQSPKPPQYARENLEIARGNLALVKQSLKQ